MRRASRLSPAAREVERADRRWLVAAVLVFAGTLLLSLGAHRVYRLTGPHPAIYDVYRRVRRFARRLLPRWRRLKADR